MLMSGSVTNYVVMMRTYTPMNESKIIICYIRKISMTQLFGTIYSL